MFHHSQKSRDTTTKNRDGSTSLVHDHEETKYFNRPKVVSKQNTEKLFSVVAHIFFQASVSSSSKPPDQAKIMRLLNGKEEDGDPDGNMNPEMLKKHAHVIKELLEGESLKLLERGFLIFWPHALEGEDDDWKARRILSYPESFFNLGCEGILDVLNARWELPQVKQIACVTFVNKQIPAFFRLIGRVDDDDHDKGKLEIRTQDGSRPLLKYNTTNPTRNDKKRFDNFCPSKNVVSRTGGGESLLHSLYNRG